MKPRGFTLLEVMISLAILAVALVAIGDVNAGAVQMHYYARRATQATLLLKGKMLDLEELLHKDGFHDFDDEKHGTFEDEGQPGYAWKAEILKPEVQLDANGLLGMLGLGGGSTGSSSSSAGGGSSSFNSALAGAAAGLQGAGLGNLQSLKGGAGIAALGPMAGLLQGQAKTFIETIKKSVRELRITVSWRDGKNERNISASQQIVILPDSVGRAGQANAPPVQGATGLPGSPLGPPVNLGRPQPFGQAGGRPTADGDSNQ